MLIRPIVVLSEPTLRNTHPVVLFDWHPSRHSEHPHEFLKTFSGTVITDGYQVYHKLAKECRNLKVSGCCICQKTFCWIYKVCQSEHSQRLLDAQFNPNTFSLYPFTNFFIFFWSQIIKWIKTAFLIIN